MKLWFSKVCELDQGNCAIEIHFFNEIDFHSLTLVKRQRIQKGGKDNKDNEWYNNVCLVLDDSDEICTSEDYGFDIKSNSPPYEIDFILPKLNVTKVQLIFRQHKPPKDQKGNYHAQVADLKIHYTKVYGSSK